MPGRPLRRDGVARATGAWLRDERAPHDHQHRDGDGCKDGPPPRAAAAGRECPNRKAIGPVIDDFEKHVVEDVPDAERNRRVPEPRLPRPACEHADGQQHDERCGFAHELDRAERSMNRAADSPDRDPDDRPAREGSRRVAASSHAMAMANTTTISQHARARAGTFIERCPSVWIQYRCGRSPAPGCAARRDR